MILTDTKSYNFSTREQANEFMANLYKNMIQFRNIEEEPTMVVAMTSFKKATERKIDRIYKSIEK